MLAASGALAQVPQQTILGIAKVVDADTISVKNRTIRLEGIDAPEMTQHCFMHGRTWPCGREAASALREWISARTVSCTGLKQDRYGRLLARCTVDGYSMGGWLVESGWAFAFRQYSSDFVEYEDDARRMKRGLWAGEFVMPWTWRECQRRGGQLAKCSAATAQKAQKVDGLRREGSLPRSQQATLRPRHVNSSAHAPYPNCAAVRAAGIAPLHRGMPGYSRRLDRDGDGVACE